MFERPKPEIMVPGDGAAPTTLVVEDLETGDGDEIGPSSVFRANIVLVEWSSGAEVYSTWEQGQPATVDLRSPFLPRCAPDALSGARVGGRRKVVVPPELGWDEDAEDVLDPDETHVIVVDVLEML